MSSRLSETYRRRRALETGACARPRGGRLTVALVYPNSYYQGMSNLGLQTVYRMLNSREDSLCERFFLPDPDDDMVLELAFAAGCDYIVTHNVKDFHDTRQLGVSALSPRDFLSLIRPKP